MASNTRRVSVLEWGVGVGEREGGEEAPGEVNG
jgi:hypothetical protein